MFNSLQPVIKYGPARENGLGCSLFERYATLLEMNRHPLMMLTIQYRMVCNILCWYNANILLTIQHKAICEFPSKEFYNGRLNTDPSVSQQFCSVKRYWPSGPNCPIAFCDVEGKEEDGSSHHKVHQESKNNRMEAEKIVSRFIYCILVDVQIYKFYNSSCILD